MIKTFMFEQYLREIEGKATKEQLQVLNQKMQKEIDNLVKEGWTVKEDFNHPAVGRMVRLSQ